MRNIDLCLFVFVSCDFTTSLIVRNNFLIDSFEFSREIITSSTYRGSFSPSFPILMPLIALLA